MSKTLKWEIAAVASLLALAAGVVAWELLRQPPMPGPAGDYGYLPDPEGTREFLSELEKPTFAEAGSDSMKAVRGVDVFLYREVGKCHVEVYARPWQCWNQGPHGSCVSFAFALGSYTAQAVDWTQGRMARPPPEVATEPIYGGSRTAARMPPIARNTGGDGSYGAAAARWIAGKCKDPAVGGILYRQVYGRVDLGEYSIPRSVQWGRDGVPIDLAREANKLKATAVAQVNTWEELCASLERGSPVVLCSTVGYGRWDDRNPVRDEHGFLPRGKSWAHAMLVWAVRHQKNGSVRDGGLIQNSWSARWASGPKWPSDQPDGSFWGSRADIEAALRQGDSFAIGGVDGFQWRVLDNGGFMEGPPGWTPPAPVLPATFFLAP